MCAGVISALASTLGILFAIYRWKRNRDIEAFQGNLRPLVDEIQKLRLSGKLQMPETKALMKRCVSTGSVMCFGRLQPPPATGDFTMHLIGTKTVECGICGDRRVTPTSQGQCPDCYLYAAAWWGAPSSTGTP